MFTKLIAMQNNLGLGHKGDILLTTQERVNANQEPIAKDIIDAEHAKELVRRWNAFEKDGTENKLKELLKSTLRGEFPLLLGLAKIEDKKMGCNINTVNVEGRIQEVEAAIALVETI